MASSVVALSSAPDPARPGTDAEASFLPAKLSKNSSSYGLHCADTSSAEAGVSGELLYSCGSCFIHMGAQAHCLHFLAVIRKPVHVALVK